MPPYSPIFAALSLIRPSVADNMKFKGMSGIIVRGMMMMMMMMICHISKEMGEVDGRKVRGKVSGKGDGIILY